MRTLSTEISPIALALLDELAEKTGQSRSEMGRKLVSNIPVYKGMLKERAQSAKELLKKKPGLSKSKSKEMATAMSKKPALAKSADDLTGRSLHELLHKKAQIPRSAMPWMKAVSKARGGKGKIVPKAPAGAKQPLHQKSKVNYAPEGGPKKVSPKSIKATSFMTPGGKLVRTKFK